MVVFVIFYGSECCAIFVGQHPRWNNFNIESKKNKFDVVNVSTGQDYVEPLMRFFKKRERRS